MARNQQNNEVQEYRTALSGLQVKEIFFGPTQVSMLCDISTETSRPKISQLWQKRIFDIIYKLSFDFRYHLQTIIYRILIK